MGMSRVAVLVPSLGRSSLATDLALDLERELLPFHGRQLWVLQGEGAHRLELPASAERLLLPAPVGFATAVNTGYRALPPDVSWVGLVNDDCQLEPHWLKLLLEFAEATPRVGAVQGLNLRSRTPPRLDGFGIGWNSWFQAVQLGWDQPVHRAPTAPTEVPGVSATAALYRRAAIDALADPAGDLFDPALGSHYEDVELSLKLRAGGWTCWCQPAARVLHLGGTTTETCRFEARVEIRSNRWAVVARWLGRSFWLVLPRLWLRDLLDLFRALRTQDRLEARAILMGWRRAAFLLARRLHAGPARPSPSSVVRFRKHLS